MEVHLAWAWLLHAAFVGGIGLIIGSCPWQALRATGPVQFTLSASLSFVLSHAAVVSLGAAWGDPALGATCAGTCATGSASPALERTHARRAHCVTSADTLWGILWGWLLAGLLWIATGMFFVQWKP